MRNKHLQEQLPEDHPMRHFGRVVEEESPALKRKRETVELVEQEAKRLKTAMDTCVAAHRTLQALGVEMYDREKMAARDVCGTAVIAAHQGFHPAAAGAAPAPLEPFICLTEFCNQNGLRGRQTSFGKLAKRKWLAEHPDYVFDTREVLANGQMIRVKNWYEHQRRFLMKVAATMLGREREGGSSSSSQTTLRFKRPPP